MVQVLLARQQLEEEERCYASGVSVPSDISTSDAVTQAMLARQKAERQDENVYEITDGRPPSLDAVAQSLAARQRAEDRDEYWSTTHFNQSNPVNSSIIQVRQSAERDREDDSHDASSPVSSVMIQVMQARQKAEEEERNQRIHPPGQNPAPPGYSALIQAMLARQQAQNEYDDGYWPKASEFNGKHYHILCYESFPLCPIFLSTETYSIQLESNRYCYKGIRAAGSPLHMSIC